MLLSPVRPVVSRYDMDAFIDLPWRLYRNDPYWVPPLKNHLRAQLDPARHPFWQHARRHLFIAERDGACVGRICAHVDYAYNSYWHQSAGCFGFFECENNSATATALFAAAAAWLRAQGMQSMCGPMSPSSTNTFGFLVSPPAKPPAFLMPYNPPWYPAFAEQNGFAILKRLLAFEVECSVCPAPVSIQRIASRLKNNPRLSVRHLSKKHFTRDVRIITDLYNDCWAAHWAYSPVSFSEMLYDFSALKYFLNEKITALAFYDNQPAGMVINLPDMNEIFSLANGSLNLKSLVRILWFHNRFSRVRSILLGFKKQFHNIGLPALVYALLEPEVRRLFSTMEGSWVHEDDRDMISLLQALGMHVSSSYAVVKRSL